MDIIQFEKSIEIATEMPYLSLNINGITS